MFYSTRKQLNLLSFLQFFLNQAVGHGRVGLPFARLHDLADEEAYGAVLAVLKVRDGLRIGIQHLA